MKEKLLAIFAALILLIPATIASDVGSGVGVVINTEDFAPRVWMCDHRLVLDDNVEPGRVTNGGEDMWERFNNYAFEGEQIQWKVLVLDKNGIEKISDVYVTVGSTQGEGNDIEANCDFHEVAHRVYDSCNAYIDEEDLQNMPEEELSQIAGYWYCTFTVETPESMYDEYWVTVEAEDLDGLMGTMDENEYWFLNPELRLDVDGYIQFDDVRPGTYAYSDTLLIQNDVDQGSGVMLDMFISGTDFYDSSNSGAMCPTTNQLALTNFDYYATNGAYSTQLDGRRDTEGYVPIGYGDHWETTFYGENEIMQTAADPVHMYSLGNLLNPGAEIAITFRLDLPSPCNGDFDTGSIYFWGEAV